jgi:hypothetical protein
MFSTMATSPRTELFTEITGNTSYEGSALRELSVPSIAPSASGL